MNKHYKTLEEFHMSLEHTYTSLRELLADITVDLSKAEHGNKAASQRVRTGTVRLEKLAKVYRKESIHAEKHEHGKKSKSRSDAKKAASHRGKAPAASAKAPMLKGKTATKPHASAMSVKHPTARVPVKGR